MTTHVTTLKLPDSLKKRIAPLAVASQKTPHAWMIEALEAYATLAERREIFVADALASRDEVDAGGVLYEAEDAKKYLRALAQNERIERPKPVRKKTLRSRPTPRKA